MSGNTKDFKVRSGIQPTVYHEAVGTVVSGSEGYYLAGASYDSKSFSVAGQTALPVSLRFKSDGTKVYVLSTSASDVMYQYSLSTAWDVSTASYDSVSLSVATQTTSPIGMYFKADGTSVYVASLSPQTVYQYDLTTAWDLSTASYASKSYNASTQMGTEMRDVLFKPDGTKMYLTSSNNDAVYQYSLSTAWDVSTASYDSKSFSVFSYDSTPQSTEFNDDGTKFYLNGQQYDSIRSFSLSTAYDISTASDDGITFDLSSQDSSTFAIALGDNGNKLYMVGITNDTIYQYSTVLTTNTLDLSTGNVFEITPTSDIQVTLTNPADSGTSSGATLLLSGSVGSSYDLAGASYTSAFSVASQEATPSSVAFKSDGTKMYVIGSTGDDVNEYALSTAWDITTASFTTNFSVSSQGTNPAGVTFKTDGTSFYITDANNFGYQYDMSTAWDVSTASYASKSHDFTSQAASPYSIKFKSDGTKMYIANAGTDDIYQYSLSTAWDISTGSYDSVTFAATDAGADCRAVEFKSDGTKMYIVSNTNDAVYQYSLSTAWDISTASYDSVSFSVTSQETTPTCVVFGNSGTNMYVAGFGNASDNVLQYSTGSAATITYDSALQFSGGTAPTSPAIGTTDVLTFNTTDGGTTYNAALAIDGAS